MPKWDMTYRAIFFFKSAKAVLSHSHAVSRAPCTASDHLDVVLVGSLADWLLDHPGSKD